MARVGGVWALCTAALLMLAGTAYAEAGDVLVLGAATAGYESRAQTMSEAIDQVRSALEQRGYRVASLSVVSAPTPPGSAHLEELHELGRKMLHGFMDLRSAPKMTKDHAALIRNAMELASVVYDSSERMMLWNLCVANVELLLLSKATSPTVQSAVAECERRFVGVREFGPAWPEALAAFARYEPGLETASLEVHSEPQGCEVLVYGAPVGTTPTKVELLQGPQEIQLRCGTRMSRLHRLELHADRGMLVRLDAEQALDPTTPVLLYPDASSLQSAVSHAAGYAHESHAASVVVVELHDNQFQLRHVDANDGSVLSTAIFGQQDAPQARVAAIDSLLSRRPPATTPRAPKSRIANWTLGSALVLSGAALAAYPLVVVARSGKCDDASSCYAGTSAANLTWLGISGALVGAGVAVLTWAPLGRHAELRVGAASIQMRGTF